LHATTCKGKNLPGNYYLDREKNMVSNLYNFCKEKLKLTDLKKENGILAPKYFQYRKYKNRVVIHASSSSDDKNWPIDKYIKLSKKLQKKGYEVSFVFSKEERKQYLYLKDLKIELPVFSELKDLFSYVYESGYMLGNDSGVGHLASSFKIPTFIIFSSKRKMIFWHPDFYFTDNICPWPIIPNIKGFRWKELYWKNFIEVYRVYIKFNKFIKKYEKLSY
jgi:ADP-heptose:LPS heptosyltransferase